MSKKKDEKKPTIGEIFKCSLSKWCSGSAPGFDHLIYPFTIIPIFTSREDTFFSEKALDRIYIFLAFPSLNANSESFYLSDFSFQGSMW